MRTTSLVSMLLIVCLGCATERYVAPIIITAPRTGLSLNKPVLTAVYDGRTAGADQNTASVLQSELTDIYGHNLEWVSYFETVPKGHVAMRFRIVKLGSSFGSRLISSVAYSTAIQSAQASATGPWGKVIGSTTGSTSIYSSSFTGEGWWNGATWIDLEVEDNRGPSLSRFTIPIAAEHREPNTWGYTSGDKAAQKSWENVSAQVTRAVDEILRVLRDSELQQGK